MGKRGSLRKMRTELIKKCEEAGCEVSQTSGGHMRVLVPGGPIIVGMGLNSGHGRGVANFRAQLRRAGIDV